MPDEQSRGRSGPFKQLAQVRGAHVTLAGTMLVVELDLPRGLRREQLQLRWWPLWAVS